MEDRPAGRQRHVSGRGNHVGRQGSGLGQGPIGSGGRNSGSGGSRMRRGGGGAAIAVLLVLLLRSCLGTGIDYDLSGQSSGTSSQYSTQGISEILGTSGYNTITNTNSWSRENNTGTLDTSVIDGARDKYTKIAGDGSDTATVLVYMCGADLESRSGMATRDLQEMIKADAGNINLLVYTGGASQWQNNAVDAAQCQIWKIQNGGMKLLTNDGDRSMVDSSTLTRFIQYGAKNYPASRYQLIFWDHGGGSAVGYGYDENHSRDGSMDLSEIQTALKDGGIKFDFVGFDACLMAGAENALAIADSADYLIASEETEPGTGWYYTNWLRQLSDDPGIDTHELGRTIIDDFISASQDSNTTLSLVDLAELSASLPSKLNAFAGNTSALIENGSYRTVSDARSSCRSFGTSSGVDQVDLVSLADALGSQEGNALADAVLSAVKYNRTGSGMSDAYGLSIYFPYQNLNRVDTMTSTYADIGMDDSYSDCVRAFAKMEASGQAASGGISSPFSMLSSGSYSSLGADTINDLLNVFLGGDLSSIGLSSGRFMKEAPLSDDAVRTAVLDNRFDPSQLVWDQGEDGSCLLSLSEETWKNVTRLEKNLYVDDGGGYIDLGLDNQFDFDDSGALVADGEGTWLAVNNQPVAYYHISTTETSGGTVIRGRIPALLNGEYVNLMVVFENDHPSGTIAGYVPDYREGETDTVAKSVEQLNDGDRVEFIADYYNYDGTYEDSYRISSAMTYDDTWTVSDVIVPEKLSLSYQFTDLYGNVSWAPALEIDNE